MLRTPLLPLLIALVVSTSGCATLVGAGIGYAVNGDQGARRGAAAGAQVDAAFLSGAIASHRSGGSNSVRTAHFRCEGLEFPSAPVDLQRAYLSDALYDCEDALRQACQCDEIY